MIALQITDIDINRAWEINPYDGTAYGALIVFLAIAIGGLCWYFLKELAAKNEIIAQKDLDIKEKDKQLKEVHDKTHEIIDVMNDKLTEIKYSNDNTKDKILHMFEYFKEKLNNI